jgi:FkbM family methyltransferase
MKNIISIIIKTICKIAFIKKALRRTIRNLLHRKTQQKEIQRILEFISRSISVDDIESFYENYEGLKIKIATKPKEDGHVNGIYWKGYSQYGPETETTLIISELVKSANIFIDIGANWGYYSLLAARVNPNIKIIAFEPHPFWCDQLKKNTDANNFNNIEVVEKAVSNESGKVIFYIDNLHPECSSLQKNATDFNFVQKESADTSKITVSSTTIDKYINDAFGNKKPKIDLIKIDVVMHEGYVLDGCKDTIRECLPDIIVEIISEQIDKENFVKILNIIDEFEYNSYWISNKGLIEQQVAKQLIPEHVGGYNYLLTQKSL